ncbi:MAG: polyprenyl diphosphate synthase [bacterium]
MAIDFIKFNEAETEIIGQLDAARLPLHIAVIMDGNGRWATNQGLPRVVGHNAGTQSVHAAVSCCRNLGVKYLTLYSFSTENWTREDSEVHALMELMEVQLRQETEYLHGQGVRVLHLGRKTGLPKPLVDAILDAEKITADNKELTLILAINYSGRAELTDAVKAIVSSGISAEDINEKTIANSLYHPDIPDPELLIRTAGEQRVSNYLLWQIAYSEFWFTNKLWPDFRGIDILQAIYDYQNRTRKFGGLV